jgi:hypothetical protein
MSTLQVRTLRQFLESDQVIDCDCSNYWHCTHTGPLKLERAIQRFGWDFDFYVGREVMAAHVYCSVCGKLRPTFRLGWKTRPNTYTGSHGAGAMVRGVLDTRNLSTVWNEPSDWFRGGKNVRKFGPRR